jgi:hypothetical protein
MNPRTLLTRPLSAYRSLWDRHPAAAFLVLLGVIIASVAGLLVAVIPAAPLALVPTGTLLAAVVLLYFALDGDS